MSIRETGLERARRQKWLTGLVVAGVTVTAAVVGWTVWTRARHASAVVQAPPSPAAGVNQQLSGYTFTRSDQGRPVFTIHAARTVSYQKDKSTILEDVTLELYGRKGDQDDILRTHRCEYDPGSGNFLAGGPVEIELSVHSSNLPGTGVQGKQRVYVETSKVSYHQDGQLADTDQPVKFHVGPASGTAVGLEYAIGDGSLELKHDIAVDLAPTRGDTERPPLHMAASSLRYDRDGGLVKLGGPVEATQGDHRVEADDGVIELDARNRVTRVKMNGHAKADDFDPLRNVEISAQQVQADFDPASGELRHITAEKDVTGESRAKGNLSHLTAERVDLEMAGRHPQPLEGTATGKVRIEVESQPVWKAPQGSAPGQSPEKKTLTAEKVHFDLRTDTHSLKQAETVGPGTLAISPSDPKAGEKVITAGQFKMTFDRRSQLESLRGSAPTEVISHPPATAPPGTPLQIGQADRLEALFNADTQTLREIRQSGNFRYQNGDRQASSDEARYDTKTQTLALLGQPQVWDPDSRIKARKMLLDLRTNTAEGEGNVQATHLRRPPPGSSSSPPGLPTNVLADKMVARRDSQTVHYEGHVRAWQGTDVLECSALDVNRLQREVRSGANVVTTFLQPTSAGGQPHDDPHAAEGTTPVTIKADFLEYFDQGRRARYHGNVRMTTQSTTLESDRLDIYFTASKALESSEVDHAEADGHVRVTQPGRVGTGDHAEYFAAPGKIVLTGGPPMLVDQDKGSTTGQRLTFFLHDDRLLVDGGDNSPSLSKHRVAP